MSKRSLGLHPDVPRAVDTARSSVISTVPPPSAASSTTLFEVNRNSAINITPEAESTPHNNVTRVRLSGQQDVPPLPTSRRSSIVYIRSEDTEGANFPDNIPEQQQSSAATTAMTAFAQWSSRAVRPLMAKGRPSNTDYTQGGSPGRGLRPLSLLQERDTNVDQLPGTRPLYLAKKTSPKLHIKPRSDENTNTDANKRTKNMKSLQLARSETNKMRAILRQQETLPDVVVRPPSTTEGVTYPYTSAY
jgi:hypothetical protein